MGSKTKKVKSAGKFGAGYGTNVRKNYNAVELKQRVRQVSPFYAKARAKRVASGIWKCQKTGKLFAGPSYSLK
jgi:large subunit ribosomal protein L37Ae